LQNCQSCSFSSEVLEFRSFNYHFVRLSWNDQFNKQTIKTVHPRIQNNYKNWQKASIHTTENKARNNTGKEKIVMNLALINLSELDWQCILFPIYIRYTTIYHHISTWRSEYLSFHWLSHNLLNTGLQLFVIENFIAIDTCTNFFCIYKVIILSTH